MRVLFVVVMLAAPGAWAQLSCSPTTKCACTANSCTCSGASCDFHCLGGACGVQAAASPSTVACEATSVCTLQVGTPSSLACEDGAVCTGPFGASSSLLCHSSATCVVSVGDQSTVNCLGGASTCVVTCAQRCTVHSKDPNGAPSCPGAAPLVDCGGGVFACGPCPADGGIPDAGPVDAGAADAGSRDAGPADAGQSDEGSADGGAGGGSLDAGGPDAGGEAIDGGPSDGGSPAGRNDGGAGDGPGDQRALLVGCGCGSADGLGWLLFAPVLLWSWRRFGRTLAWRT